MVVLHNRKKNSPLHFFNDNDYKSKENKRWVVDQFEQRSSECPWNSSLAIPIIPAIHGTDFLIAGMI
jgi:hypothetical protein